MRKQLLTFSVCLAVSSLSAQQIDGEPRSVAGAPPSTLDGLEHPDRISKVTLGYSDEPSCKSAVVVGVESLDAQKSIRVRLLHNIVYGEDGLPSDRDLPGDGRADLPGAWSFRSVERASASPETALWIKALSSSTMAAAPYRPSRLLPPPV